MRTPWVGPRPSDEQLRTMSVRDLHIAFEIGVVEAQRLKVEQQIRDKVAMIDDVQARFAILDLLFLITGRR